MIGLVDLMLWTWLGDSFGLGLWCTSCEEPESGEELMEWFLANVDVVLMG